MIRPSHLAPPSESPDQSLRPIHRTLRRKRPVLEEGTINRRRQTEKHQWPALLDIPGYAVWRIDYPNHEPQSP